MLGLPKVITNLGTMNLLRILTKGPAMPIPERPQNTLGPPRRQHLKETGRVPRLTGRQQGLIKKLPIFTGLCPFKKKRVWLD